MIVDVDVSKLLCYIGKVLPMGDVELMLMIKYEKPVGNVLERFLTYLETTYPLEKINYEQLVFLLTNLEKILSNNVPAKNALLLSKKVKGYSYKKGIFLLEVEYVFDE